MKQLGILNFEFCIVGYADFELFNLELADNNSKLKTQNSKLLIASGNNSKLKIQNSKIILLWKRKFR